MDRTSIMSRAQSGMPMGEFLPHATTMRLPSVVGAVNGLGATDSGLTPDLLVQRLPSIVNPAPVVVGPACSDLTNWVSGNPILAALALAGVAYFAMRHGK